MKTINVTSAFNIVIALPTGGNKQVHVPQGVSTVEDEIADHWYTKAHLASGGIGSPDYASSVRAQADAAFVHARDAMSAYALLEAAAQEAESGAGLEPVAPASERLALPLDPGDQADEPKPSKARRTAKPAAEAVAETSTAADAGTQTSADAAAALEGGPAADVMEEPAAPAEAAAQEAEGGASAAEQPDPLATA